MSLVLFSGSLGSQSLNKKLLAYASKVLNGDLKTKATIIDIKGLDIPIYDSDTEEKIFPAGIKTLGDAIIGARGLVIASPEYNGSISSPLKNTIDWLSRLKPLPFAKKPVLLLSASPGDFGGIRGLLHTSVPLDILGAYVFPQNFGLARAHQAFSESGDLIDQKAKDRVANLLNDYLKFVEAL